MFMLIETTTVALLVASYFYLWRNYPQSGWPPPQGNTDPPLLDPLPNLFLGTLNTVLLLATVPLMSWLARVCARRFDELEQLNASKPSEVPDEQRPDPRPTPVLIGLGALVALGLISCVIRWFEFPELKVAWNDNAYGSIIWALLGLHFLYLAIEVVEVAVLLLWIVVFELGENQATDVGLTAEYWYWTVGVWVVMYVVVYLFPRVVG